MTNNFHNNRKRLSQITDGMMVVSANLKMEMSMDTAYPFRQDSNFYYLTGVNEPGWILVIGGDKGDYLIAPKRSSAEVLFDGAENYQEIKKISAVGNVYSHKEGWECLRKQIKNISQVYLPISSSKINWQIAPNPAGTILARKLKVASSKTEIRDLRPNLAKIRSIKQKYEIDLIQEAVSATCVSLKNVRTKLPDLKAEKDVEAFITNEFNFRYHAGHAYDPIVAGGKNATTIHYIKNDSALKSGNLLLIDAGIYLNNYCGDISRTYSIGGKPTSRQRDIHIAVESVVSQTLEILKPGIRWRDYVSRVEKIMGEELVKLKLIKSAKDEVGIRRYFPHLVSHSLGLDVHDPVDYTEPLRAGMVITVEPGIYIPEEKIGIRIEEDVLITEKANQVLSSSLSTDL